MRRVVPVVLGGALVAFGSWLLFQGVGRSTQAVEERGGRTVNHLSQLPLYFVENRGQTDKQVGYYARGRDTSVYFVPGGVVFALSEPQQAAAGGAPRLERVAIVQSEQRERWAVKLEFVGANPEARPEGVNRTDAVVSHFTGPREQWVAGLATYAGVRYREVWPGIDLEYTGTQGQLKYTFTVAPGADASRIRLAYHGAEGVELTPDGRIEIRTPAGGFAEDAPYVYQEVDGRQVAVDAAYELDGDAFAFRLGAYDRRLPLVLDPAVLVYAGFIGGSGSDTAVGIAVDSSGNAYVTGYTASDQAAFPAKVGPDLSFNGGARDVFVAKVNAEGTALVYAGYIGGSGVDYATAIAVDASGNAYIAGYTPSDQTTFPVTVGPNTRYNGGSSDAFVAKVNAAGTALVYAGYIGGSGSDVANGIAVDAAGNAYVTGLTGSTEATFPVAVGPDTTFNGADSDAFVAKVSAAGTGVEYAGYIGGSGRDEGNGIAVDASGNAYVTGLTYSTEATFPAKVGPDLTFNGGNHDGFVAKVNAAGTGLDYAGYIGGSGLDFAIAIAVDGSGSAYVTGRTTTADGTFPVTVGPDLTFNGGTWDGYLAKVNPAGTALEYCGFIGGGGGDYAWGIAVDTTGNAYVTGATSSSEATFPTAGGFDTTYAGDDDAFVVQVNAAGTAFVLASYLGGSGEDGARGIALDGGGNLYIVGGTESSDGTFTATVGPDLSYNGGGSDAYVAKIQAEVPPRPSVTAIVSAASYSGGGVSPGEIVAIYGADLGPVTGVSNSGWEPSTGRLPTTLGGTSVAFDGHAAPLFYVSAGQINAQVPYEVAGKASANVVVTRTGSASQTFTEAVVASHPGVFVYNDRAIVTDNATGTLITTENGIAREAYANIWATGPGVVSPAATTGAPASGSQLSWAANPQVWINGGPVEVAFAGLTPGMTGLLQVTVKIPASAPAGASVPLKISINGVAAQAYLGGAVTTNLTIALR